MSDQQAQQKRIETFYLKQFLQASGIEMAIVDDNREEPDFGVIYQGNELGLEVTQLFKENFEGGAPLQARESFWSGVLLEAKKIYLGNGNPLCNVKLLLSPTALSMLKYDKQAVIAEILSLLADTEIPEPFEQVRVEGNDNTPHITSMHVTAITDEITPRWTCVNNDIGWVRTITGDFLMSLIRKKEKRLPSYQTSFSENILFIFVEAGKDSGMVRLDGPTEVETRFEKVFLYFHPEEWLELK